MLPSPKQLLPFGLMNFFSFFEGLAQSFADIATDLPVFFAVTLIFTTLFRLTAGFFGPNFVIFRLALPDGGEVSGRRRVLEFRASLIVSSHELPVSPAQAPLRPAPKALPDAGTAVRVTFEYAGKSPLQLVPQLIPAGAEVIEPEPAPDFVT